MPRHQTSQTRARALHRSALPPPIPPSPRPTKEQLAAAIHRRVPDLATPGLKVLFCGINPGLYTAAIGHHFGRPGNRFWPSLWRGGFTPRQLQPNESRLLLDLGYGIVNLVDRPTVAADELTPDELRAGAKKLARKLWRWQPGWLAVLGVTSFRVAFEQPKAVLGEQPEPIAGTRVWVLPNPSGLNAHHQLPDLERMFRALRLRVEATTCKGQMRNDR
ncbi:MAG: G/U mismatch-specific DNA glycosylase [Pirellulales bacterium]|nr:G/U mismatch-specific DNA glycosylase [Pirellulales bacterium]